MKRIGKYIVCGLLGQGGMSTVYKVRMPVLHKIVALKLLSPHQHLVDLLGQKEIRRRFTSEAVVMANLRHPHIVDVWDFDKDADGRCFFVMEYYCNNLGMVLGEAYRLENPSRALNPDKALAYTKQALSGLLRLHDAGIVHRDIKPYNILLTDQDTVKITDFGLSKLRGETFPGPRQLMVGSPYYAAPEQEADPDRADIRSDIYSMGVMFYRMLTGLLPQQEAPEPSRHHPLLDSSWDRFLRRALAPKGEDRFPSIREMQAGLAELERAWKARKEKVCRFPSKRQREAERETEPLRGPLRRECIKVRPREAPEAFGTDELGRPVRLGARDFQVNNDGTVTDPSTGLVWQQGGSDFPMTWHEAHEYIEELNKTAFAGGTDWRLPTVNELLSIVTLPLGEDFCLEPVFDPRQRWLWSCDKRSFIAAWHLNADMGCISWQDFTCCYFVRGARAMGPASP